MRWQVVAAAVVLVGSFAIPSPAAAGRPPAPNVVAWGYDTKGPIGVPRDLTDAVAIAAGEHHALALRADGTLVAWGSAPWAATAPRGLRDVVAIAAGSQYNAAVRRDGTVTVWGWENGGKLTPPPDLHGVRAVAVGDRHMLALLEDGTVTGWGDDLYGQATPPPLLRDVVAVSAGTVQSWALRRDGTLVGWGGATDGEYMDPACPGCEDPGPERAQGAVEFAARNVAGTAFRYAGVDADELNALLVRADGGVAVIARQDQTAAPYVPEEVARLRDVTAVALGGRLSAVLRRDGTVVGWNHGPVRVAAPAGLRGVTAVAAGEAFGLALLARP